MCPRQQRASRRSSTSHCCASPVAAVAFILLLQCMIASPVIDAHSLPLPATSALLRRWWNNETVVAASLAQRIALDVAALLIGSTSTLPPHKSDRCTSPPSSAHSNEEVSCACDCSTADSASSLVCDLCRRVRLRLRSSSGANLQWQPRGRWNHPPLQSTRAALDNALSSLFSQSTPSHALHSPALADNYRHLTRLHDTLLTDPKQLQALFPSIPTTASSTSTTATSLPSSSSFSSTDLLYRLSHLTSLAWQSAWSGGGGGGGLGYQIRCDLHNDSSVMLWSMGGGGGGGCRANIKPDGARWTVHSTAGSGGGAGLHWDRYNVGGGSGGGLRLKARLSSSFTPLMTSINVSQGAQPDAVNREAPPPAALSALNRTLTSRMRHCIRAGHTLRIGGGGGAGGGHRLRVRLRADGGDRENVEQVELVSHLHHALAFHFELSLDQRALSTSHTHRQRAEW